MRCLLRVVLREKHLNQGMERLVPMCVSFLDFFFLGKDFFFKMTDKLRGSCVVAATVSPLLLLTQ